MKMKSHFLNITDIDKFFSLKALILNRTMRLEF